MLSYLTQAVRRVVKRLPVLSRLLAERDELRARLAAAEQALADRDRSPVRDPAYRTAYQMSLAEWLLYHQEQIVYTKTTWMGLPILKTPLDCWIYQELLWTVRPEIVLELGSYVGGSTLFFGHLLDALGQGQVISVDIDRTPYRASHPRVLELTGDATSPEVVAQVRALCAGRRVLAIHDANHRKDAVLQDLRLYADLVSVGSYFIVEDGIVDLFDPAVAPTLGEVEPGPLPALREFLAEDDRFVVDAECERYRITYNPSGYLKRVR